MSNHSVNASRSATPSIDAAPNSLAPATPPTLSRSGTVIGTFPSSSTMSHETSSRNSLVIRELQNLPKLTVENWDEWSWHVQQALKMGGTWHYFFKKHRDSANILRRRKRTDCRDQKERDEWDTNATLTTFWLERAVGRETASIIRSYIDIDEPDPQGAWDALSAKFDFHTSGTRVAHLTKITTFSRAADESYESVFTRLDDLISQHQRHTPADWTASDIRDELAVMAIIRTIDTSFPLHSAFINDDNLTLETCKDRIRKHEASATIGSRLQDGPTQTQAMLAVMESAYTAASPEKVCFFCRAPNHSVFKCDLFKHFQEFVATNNTNVNSLVVHLREVNQLLQRLSNQNPNLSLGPALASALPNSGRKPKKKQKGTNGPNTGTLSANVAMEAASQYEYAGKASTTRLPNESLSDTWTADSGATSCMTPRGDWLRDAVPVRRGIRLADDSIIWSVARGTVKCQPTLPGSAPYYIRDVLLVPELRNNLFSILRFSSQSDQSVLFKGRKALFNRGVDTLFTSTVRDNLSFLDVKVIPAPLVSELANTAVDLATLHRRFNHTGHRKLKEGVDSGSIRGVNISSTLIPRLTCVPCVSGKMTKAPHTQLAERAKSPLEHVFSDVHGPVKVPGIRGETYWVLFIDDYSRLVAVYLMKKKSEVFDKFRQYKAWAENQMNSKALSWDDESIRRTIKALRDDKGGEYVSAQMTQFCIDHGIEREHTIRDTPQQNGVAERFNRTLGEGIVTLLTESKLPPSAWSYAVAAFVHVHNRTPSHSTNMKTPYELWNGHAPSVDSLRVFGCEAWVHQQKTQRTYFGAHAVRCVFVGYSPDSSGWLFVELETGKERKSDSARFDENIFPGKLREKSMGNSPYPDMDFLFDFPPMPIASPIPVTYSQSPRPPDPPLAASPIRPSPQPSFSDDPPILPNPADHQDDPTAQPELPSFSSDGEEEAPDSPYTNRPLPIAHSDNVHATGPPI